MSIHVTWYPSPSLSLSSQTARTLSTVAGAEAEAEEGISLRIPHLGAEEAALEEVDAYVSSGYTRFNHLMRICEEACCLPLPSTCHIETAGGSDDRAL